MKEENHVDNRTDLALALLDEYRNTSTDDLYNGIMNTIARKQRRRKAIRRMAKYAAVLVPVLIVVAASVFITSNNERNSGMRIDGRIMLTIDDGAQFILDDSAGDGRIAELGDVSVSLSEGRLIYEAKGMAPEQTDRIIYNTLNVQRGMSFDLILEDGTHVWLNAGSQMRFPSAFRGDERRVYIEGEAYFDVAQNPEMPFIVETRDQILTVTGTKFNICTYPEDYRTYTTLVNGSVVLNSVNDNKMITLTPGEMATLDQDGYKVEKVDTADVAIWREGLFAFSDQPLEQVFACLARWYDIEYTFEDRAAARMVLMGNIPIFEEAEPVLDIIEASGGVSIDRRGKAIRIFKK